MNIVKSRINIFKTIKPTIPKLRTMSTKKPSELAKITKIVDLESKDAKWVKLQKIHYTNPNGEARDWEMTARTTRIPGQEIDGVGIIALVKDPSNPTDSPKIVLQKQFRPPVEAVCIEFPAGLLDPNETALECAIRELHEETGYVVTKDQHLGNSEIMFNDAGFTNTNLISVMLEVDLSTKENQNPIPQLEENEFIETFLVNLAELPEELEKLSEKGYKVDSKVASIAAGLKLSRAFNLGK
ncbi:ADP-ribose diphosphatase [Saccharomycopsis crataegensis]|uniref:ADP-ribose diphosphatase n=1 Tax=Saccharomycopsis crataegensis TaxID=43959 RepID=A0AAV5QFW0_9ASCO|nr:ADP-ribose diphosphatase [Saccharomycopsis crataegensis]